MLITPPAPPTAITMQFPAQEQLPDPFVLKNGKRVVTKGDWKKRRQEIQTLLENDEYGHLPPAPRNLRATLVSSLVVNNGAARQEKISVSCGPRHAVKFDLELLIPQGKKEPFAVILTGDAGTTPIPDEVVARGYLLAHFDRTQFAPDDATRDKGIYPLYPQSDAGALAAWAWGYSRAVDYLLQRPDVDAKRIAIAGHSRGGKAVALAGALDKRIALTFPNQSGTGGASPFRLPGKGSESIAKITGRFGYWFHPHLQTFAGREAQLPFDQHFLLALIAPRALLLNTALQDPYSNPASTHQSFLATREVFDFLGASDKIGSHVRDGGHSFGAQDWQVLLDFADRQFFGRPTTTNFAGMSENQSAAAFSWRAPRFLK